MLQNNPSVSGKAGLLCNPLSGRLQGRMPAIRKLAAAYPAVIFLQASTPEQMGTAVDRMIAEGAELLILAGGDGTVQAVLNHLLANRHIDRQPLITIIPGGTTNMTASDLGIQGNPAKLLASLLLQLQQPVQEEQVIRRPVLCVRQETGPAVYGMFFGAGYIANGVKYFHKRIRSSGITGEIASAVVIVRFLISLLLRRRGAEFAALRAAVKIDGGREYQGHYTIVLASTLNRLLLGMRPYWGKGNGPIHTTFVRENAGRFWRSLLPLIRGRGDTLHEGDGYYSRNSHILELLIDGDFIVDGELFNAQIQHGPVRITVTEPLAFYTYAGNGRPRDNNQNLSQI